MLTPNPSAVYDLCYNIHQIGVKIKVLYKACIRNLDLISSGAVCSIRELWSYFYSQIYRNIAQCVHHSTAFSALYIYKKVCCKLWCNYLCGPFRHIWMGLSTLASREAGLWVRKAVAFPDCRELPCLDAVLLRWLCSQSGSLMRYLCAPLWLSPLP